MKKLCEVPGCNKPFYGLGYCRVHYRRFKKYNDPLVNYNTPHNMSLTKIYNRWRGMKQRCNDKNNVSYKNYGGRGIKVCDKWNDSFIAFYDDMGEPPTSKHTIERENNKLGYFKENCRWASYYEQMENKRPPINKHGLQGVYKTKNTYYSMIVTGGNKKYLGSFKTTIEAHSAYMSAKKEKYESS